MLLQWEKGEKQMNFNSKIAQMKVFATGELPTS